MQVFLECSTFNIVPCLTKKNKLGGCKSEKIDCVKNCKLRGTDSGNFERRFGEEKGSEVYKNKKLESCEKLPDENCD